MHNNLDLGDILVEIDNFSVFFSLILFFDLFGDCYFFYIYIFLSWDCIGDIYGSYIVVISEG